MVFNFCSKTKVLNKIKIKEGKRGSDYTVTLNNDKVIETTVADTSDDTLNNWLQEMHQLHTDKKNDNLLVSLSAGKIDDNGYCRDFYDWSSKPTINMLKFGVGSYCLLLQISDSSIKCQTDVEDGKAPLPPFKGFISSNKITFVGFNIDKIMDKLNKEHELRVAKTLDLERLHVYAFHSWYYSVRKIFPLLVKLVFRNELDEKDFKKLKCSKSEKIKYWKEDGDLKCKPVYSHDNVKISTVEVYFCHLVAVKCQEVIEDRRRTWVWHRSYDDVFLE